MAEEKQHRQPSPKHPISNADGGDAGAGFSGLLGNIIKGVTFGVVALRVAYSMLRARTDEQCCEHVAPQRDNIERNADAKDGSRALPSSSGEPVVSSHGSRSDGPVAATDESMSEHDDEPEAGKRKIGIISDTVTPSVDLRKRQCVEKTTREKGEGISTDDTDRLANTVEEHDVGQLVAIHGVDPDESHVVWFAISQKSADMEKERKRHVRFLHEVSLDQKPLLYCSKQKDIDAVRSRIMQNRGGRYFVHPAGGRFLKSFRVNTVRSEAVGIPRAHYRILYTWQETKKTDGLNHLFAIHISDDEVARLRESLGINEANRLKNADYTHEFVGKRVICTFSPGYTTLSNETTLDIARKHDVDIAVIIAANIEKYPGLQADTKFEGGRIVLVAPTQEIPGKVTVFHPALGDGEVDLWTVVHDDGDYEDLELHELVAAMKRYEHMQSKPSVMTHSAEISQRPPSEQPVKQQYRTFAPPYS